MDPKTVGCCHPYRKPFPSGWAWAHSKWCKVAPNQKVAPPPHYSPPTRRGVTWTEQTKETR